ncbi:MAG: DUF362 domain-containing protein [Candidatus Firestonebacteria bacterium]|nr:DUF362 domain-containing protein [Candidatus Firestonebacteria bacterium]
MSKSRVALVRCESYDAEVVEKALARGLALLGGAAVFVRPGEPVLLKPNLLTPDPPERCVTTHPAVFQAVARLFQAAGSAVVYGDSPAVGSPASVAKKAGLEAVAAELGVTLADFVTPVEVSFPAGRQNKKFILAKAVADNTHALVNLPKMKTHGLMRATGAVKNLFGCVPGLLKAEFHVKLPNAHPFARMLVDLNLCVRPRLSIMDGVMAMQGNGPRSGTPLPVHALLISNDPVALDAVVTRLMDMDPQVPPTAQYGRESGLGTYLQEEIEILGDTVEALRPRRFKANKLAVSEKEPKGSVKFLKQWLVPRPVIARRRCTRCGTCVKMCPVSPKAVDWKAGDKSRPPVYTYDRCIRCYCCQELCPERAIKIRTPLLGRIVRRG